MTVYKIKPMTKHLLISLSDLKEKKRFTAWLEQQEVMAVMTPQGVRVYSGMCPHQGGPLGEGTLTETSITCPWHGCSFKLDQGDCTDIGACRNVSGMKLKALPFSIGPDQNVYVEFAS
jgi:nitrite reductase/ring-hydroxylating ferredoxin subunit